MLSIQSIKKEYQRDVNENNHWKKRNEQLEHIIKEERKKQNKSLKIKHTESSGSEDGYNYYCKKKNLQSKEKINKNIMIMNTAMTKIIPTVQG